MNFHFTPEAAIARLINKEEGRFTRLLEHGTLSVEYYAPELIDPQVPHLQDELYVIASGNSRFFRAGERVHCKAGDVLFVPAGMEHRFEDFSEDFATWVIFYGPQGGEAGVK